MMGLMAPPPAHAFRASLEMLGRGHLLIEWGGIGSLSVVELDVRGAGGADDDGDRPAADEACEQRRAGGDVLGTDQRLFERRRCEVEYRHRNDAERRQ